MHLIKSAREYHEVYRNHQKRHGTLFVFLLKKVPLPDQAVGIVVSKKVGKAVRRNKIKRRVKAYIREHMGDLPQGKLVIIAKPGAGEANWNEIKADLASYMPPEESV